MTRDPLLGTGRHRPVLPDEDRARFRRPATWWVALLGSGVVGSVLTLVIMCLLGWRDAPPSPEGGGLVCPSGVLVFEPEARLDTSVLRVVYREYRDRRQ